VRVVEERVEHDGDVVVAVEVAVALQRVDRDPIRLGIEAVKRQVDVVRVDQHADLELP